MRLSDFDYALPPELIAQTPIEPRDAARLLVFRRPRGELVHRRVRDLPDLLKPGDLLVANRSRVMPARVRGKLRGGGSAELLLLLHVGLDTFRPVTEEDPRAHAIHQEWYSVPPDAISQIERARASNGRIVAIGTTSVRALETWATTGATEGWTDLFILPGHRFKVVDALLTNFHLPRSSLLLLVSAFAGREPVLAAYAEAIRLRYRCYSFGDAMLILPEPGIETSP